MNKSSQLKQFCIGIFGRLAGSQCYGFLLLFPRLFIYSAYSLGEESLSWGLPEGVGSSSILFQAAVLPATAHFASGTLLAAAPGQVYTEGRIPLVNLIQQGT